MARLTLYPEFSEAAGVALRAVMELPGQTIPPITYQYFGELPPREPTSHGWAVLAALPFAMQRKLDIHCAGAVDRQLLDNLEEYVQAWNRWQPSQYHRVAITAEREVDSQPVTGKDAVHAFSGGLDSAFSLHAHATKLLGRRSRDIRAAVFLDLEEKGNTPDVIEDLAAIAASYDVPLVTVRTNVREFCSRWTYSHIAAIASVLHQYAGTVSQGTVAADFPYEAEIRGWGNTLASNALVTGNCFQIITSCAGWSRTEKARFLLDNPVVTHRLRSCYMSRDGSRNCGRCDKCIRTSLNFIAAGATHLPAIGKAPRAADIRRIIVRSDTQRNFYNELLSVGDWSAAPELRAAVKAIVSRTRLSNSILKSARRLQSRISWRVHRAPAATKATAESR